MKDIREIIDIIVPTASNKEVARYRTRINSYIKKYKIIYKKENRKMVLDESEAKKVIAHFKNGEIGSARSISKTDYVRHLEEKVAKQQEEIDQLNNRYLSKIEEQNKELREANRALGKKFDRLMQLMNQQQQLHGRDQKIKEQGSLERKERNIDNELKEPVRKNEHWWQKIFK